MSDAELAAGVSQRDKAVVAAMGIPIAAVRASLQDPPYTATQLETKVASAKVVAKALAGVPEKEIGSVIGGLDGEEQALLMKYIYRALGAVENQQGSQVLLRWHAALTDKVGMGLISRALSESDTV